MDLNNQIIFSTHLEVVCLHWRRGLGAGSRRRMQHIFPFVQRNKSIKHCTKIIFEQLF